MFKTQLREKLEGIMAEHKETLDIVIDIATELHSQLVEVERKAWYKETYHEAVVIVSKIYSQAEQMYRDKTGK